MILLKQHEEIDLMVDTDPLGLRDYAIAVSAEMARLSAETQGAARFDLRLRSIDREPGEPLYACTYSSCGATADWSVWLKTPDDSPTYTLCERHALAAVAGTTVRLTP